MDQAIRSALNKYHGKTGKTPAAAAKPNRVAIGIFAVIIVLAGFALCVKFDWLHAGKAWQALSSVSIGSKTIGQLASELTGGEKAPETDDTAPVNPTGESGQIEPSQTVSVLGAHYLDYVESKLRVAVPLEGTVTCAFGNRIHPITGKESFHTGLDIAADEGTAVAAYQSGTVFEVGRSNTYGNYILLDHNGRQTFYGHLSAVDVEEDRTVAAGEVIGKVGSTGLSTGPHLHFEIRIDGERVDPADYV